MLWCDRRGDCDLNSLDREDFEDALGTATEYSDRESRQTVSTGSVIENRPQEVIGFKAPKV